MNDFTYCKSPQCKHNRAVSLKWNPHSPAGPAGGVLGRGQAEVTQVVLLLFHRPRSGWADDPGQTWSLGRFWNTCPDSTRSNRHRTASKPLWYHSYLRIPRLNADTKPARAGTLLHTLPYSKKASTDLKLCLKVRDGIERHKEKRKSMQKVRTVTPGSRRKDVRWFLPLSTESITSCRRQLTALSTLECGPFVRFQT